MFKLNNLKAPIGSNHYPKRKGRGIGSGLGKTAGKGHKGQKARAGGQMHPSFEGGQIPLQRRSPKVGFVSHLKKRKVSVNVTELSKFAGKDVTLKDLIPGTLTQGSKIFVAVFGTKVPKKLPKSVEAHRFSPAILKLLGEKGVQLKKIEYAKTAAN